MGIQKRIRKIIFIKQFLASRGFYAVIALAVIAIILGAGYYIGRFAEPKKYFYERIVVSGQDKSDQPVFLVLEAIRQQTSLKRYDHSYSISFLYHGKKYNEAAFFHSPSETIQTNEFITAFNYSVMEETTQENYNLDFRVGGKNIEIDLRDLEGDFLVKNSLDYIRYISPGKAVVKIDKEQIYADGMVDKILSNDSSELFISANTKLVANSIIVWDKDGNSYHVDVTDVHSTNTSYKSHKWVLYKNSDGTVSRKLYEVELIIEKGQGNRPMKWIILIPAMRNTQIILDTMPFVTQNDTEFTGMAQGKIQDNNGQKDVQGYFFYKEVE